MPSVYENENKADPSFTVFKPWKPSAVTKNLPEIPTKSLLTTLFPVLDYQTPAFTSFNKKYTVQQPEYFDSPTSNKLCLDGKFDAITLQSDGYTYVFKDVYVYRIDSNFVLDNTYPRLISNVFRGWNGITFMTLPNNIDTILFLPDTGMTYFLRIIYTGDQVKFIAWIRDILESYLKILRASILGMDLMVSLTLALFGVETEEYILLRVIGIGDTILILQALKLAIPKSYPYGEVYRRK